MAAAMAAVAERPENIAKLRRRVAATPVVPLAPPRAGKKLLVLDIDYTLFDHRRGAPERAKKCLLVDAIT